MKRFDFFLDMFQLFAVLVEFFLIAWNKIERKKWQKKTGTKNWNFFPGKKEKLVSNEMIKLNDLVQANAGHLQFSLKIALIHYLLLVHVVTICTMKSIK